MKSLTEIFNIQQGDVVSIVGSGGKTSLLFKLAKELKNDYKVLVSTSTRILIPSNDCYDYLFTNLNSFINNKPDNLFGVTVISKNINRETNKLIGINDEELDALIQYFDIILLEADGSKELPLKGWKKHEPPVLNKTTKTIGVMPANLINKTVNKEFIYGFDEFNILTDNSEYINFEAIGKIVTNKNGIFKNSKGRQYLFLNKADTDELISVSRALSQYLHESKISETFKICFGSLKKGVYYEY